MEQLQTAIMVNFAIKTLHVMLEYDQATGLLKLQQSNQLLRHWQVMQENTSISAVRIGRKLIHAKCSGVEMVVNALSANLVSLILNAT